MIGVISRLFNPIPAVRPYALLQHHGNAATGSRQERNWIGPMTAQSKLLYASVLIALTVAGAACADSVEVGGNLVNTSVVGRATNAATGAFSTAKQSIGSIGSNVKVGGSITSTTVVNEATNISSGLGTTAETYLGSVPKGTNTPGSIKQTVVVKKVINSISGFGGTSCVSVGYGDPC